MYMHVCPDSPEIYEQLQNQFVAQPSTATFVCSAVSNPRPTLTWQRLKNGVVTMCTINQSSKYGIVIASTGDQNQNQTSTLMIFNTSPGDTSQYTCFAENIQGHTQSTVYNSECTRWVYVTYSNSALCTIWAMYFTGIPIIYQAPQDNTVVLQSTTAIFDCSASGQPTLGIEWFQQLPNGTLQLIADGRSYSVSSFATGMNQPIVHNNCHGQGCRNLCLPCKQWRNNILLKLSYP